VNFLGIRRPDRSVRVVIISGLSGSGKSTAIRALEDIGFFCIDNLPVVMLPKLIELFPSQPEEIEQIALVIDARESRFLDDFELTLARVREGGGRVDVIFLDCSESVLQQRYSETRRRHPLSKNGSVEEGIRNERHHLLVLRKAANRIIDTSGLNPHQLRKAVQQYFSQTKSNQLNLAILSFGFKHGVPPLIDLVFDVRFLPNPYFVPELRDRVGTDQSIRDFVLQSSESGLLIEHVMDYLDTFRPYYDREGKSYLTLGIGCTGGRHRSVVIAEQLGKQLIGQNVPVDVRHRDIERL
jgi:UPF0042 nucleotide-binding protein